MRRITSAEVPSALVASFEVGHAPSRRVAGAVRNQAMILVNASAPPAAEQGTLEGWWWAVPR